MEIIVPKDHCVINFLTKKGKTVTIICDNDDAVYLEKKVNDMLLRKEGYCGDLVSLYMLESLMYSNDVLKQTFTHYVIAKDPAAAERLIHESYKSGYYPIWVKTISLIAKEVPGEPITLLLISEEL